MHSESEHDKVGGLGMKPRQRIMCAKSGFALVITIGLLMVTVPTMGQHQQPLTNVDAISMVKSGLSEAVIIDAIKASDSNFDTSAKALIALQKASVPPKIMQAMIDAGARKKSAMAPAAQAETTAPTTPAQPMLPPGASSAMPAGAAANPAATPAVAPAAGGGVMFMLLSGNTKQPLAAEKLQVAPTQAKESTLQALALDNALNQVLQAGVQDVATRVAARTKLGGPSAGVTQAGNVIGGLFTKKSKPTFTYAWALPGATSSSAVAAASGFEVTYAGIPGINPDDYEPHIVKLSPTKDQGWRLVGAAKATEELAQSTSPTWPVYSSFIEDTVPLQIKKAASGDVIVTPTSQLTAGEYAIVLRPVVKSKKFAGTELTNGQGEGLVFDSASSFSVK